MAAARHGYHFILNIADSTVKVEFSTGMREISLSWPVRRFQGCNRLSTHLHTHPIMNGRPGVVRSACPENPLECPSGAVATTLLAAVDNDRPSPGSAPARKIRQIIASEASAGRSTLRHTCANRCMARKRKATKRLSATGLPTRPRQRIKAMAFLADVTNAQEVVTEGGS